LKNILLSERTRADINRRIERVLKGLDNPEPPLRLQDVRELLALDRRYYTGDDDGVLQETISRLRVAGIQVVKRPSLLVRAVRKFDLKALYLPDQKRILLDQSQPKPKHRWNEAHEIGHSLLPWHQDMMLGDDVHCVTPACHAQIEAEASFAGGQLLFLRERFVQDANDSSVTIENMRTLHKLYGNTLTTTLWRYIEESHAGLPMVGVISPHPHRTRRPTDFDNSNPCRYFIQSPAFFERFSNISERELFWQIASYCGAQRGGMLGQAEKVLVDSDGDRHIFSFQTFFDRYDALTLAIYDRPYNIAVAVMGN